MIEPPLLSRWFRVLNQWAGGPDLGSIRPSFVWFRIGSISDSRITQFNIPRIGFDYLFTHLPQVWHIHSSDLGLLGITNHGL